MKIKGNVTPEIAHMLQGYDLDIRTVRNNVTLHFDNGHVKTHLVALKLGSNRYEVEVIEDPLYLFKDDLEKGDLMNASEIANVVIRQTLKEKDMKINSSNEKKHKRSKYNGMNVTGCEDGNLTTPSSPSGEGAVASSVGLFIDENDDFEAIVNSLEYVPDSKYIVSIGNCFFIPNENGLSLAQALTQAEDSEFYTFFNEFANKLPKDKLNKSMKKSQMSKGDLYIFDIDNFLDITARDFGTFNYFGMDHEWKWSPNNSDYIPVTVKEMISILDFAQQARQKTKDDRKLQQTAWLLFEKIKK